MAEKTKLTPRQEAEQGSVVWLTVYEASKRIGNSSMMERARQELAKQGVIVLPQPATPERVKP